MKKALLFALLFFALNVFGQSERQSIISRHLSTYSPVELRGTINPISPGKVPRFCGIDPGKTGMPRILESRSLKQVYDSIYEWQWDTLRAGWQFSYKYTSMVYDDRYNLTSYTILQKSSNIWPNFRKYTFTYDVSNNQTSTLEQVWTGTAWENFILEVMTWDASKNRTGELVMQWRNSAWTNITQYLSVYDASNNEINITSQDWDGNFWVNAYQTLNTYDGNNNKIRADIRYWVSTAWVNYVQFNYSYNADNLMINFLYKSWAGSEWVNLYQEAYTYNALKNPDGFLGQNWNGAGWDDHFRGTFTYDANNHQSGFLQEVWNGTDWINYSRNLYNIGTDNFIKSESYLDWNADGIKIKDGDSTYNYFHTAEGITEPAVQKQGTLIFPNPCNGKLTISTTTPLTAVEIYTMAGMMVISENLTGQPRLKTLDLSALSPGIYIIKIFSGDRTHIEKLVIQ